MVRERGDTIVWEEVQGLGGEGPDHSLHNEYAGVWKGARGIKGRGWKEGRWGAKSLWQSS